MICYNDHFTEKPKWVIWLIGAIVGHYTDKKTHFLHIFESFCPCTDPLWLKWVKWIIWVFVWFTRRKCIWYGPDKVPGKKNTGVMDFYALKLRSTSKSQLENIHSRIVDVRDIRWPRNEYEQGHKLGSNSALAIINHRDYEYNYQVDIKSDHKR